MNEGRPHEIHYPVYLLSDELADTKESLVSQSETFEILAGFRQACADNSGLVFEMSVGAALAQPRARPSYRRAVRHLHRGQWHQCH